VIEEGGGFFLLKIEKMFMTARTSAHSTRPAQRQALSRMPMLSVQ